MVLWTLLRLANASGDSAFPRRRDAVPQDNKPPLWPGLFPGAIQLSTWSREAPSGFSWVSASRDVQCTRTNPHIYRYLWRLHIRPLIRPVFLTCLLAPFLRSSCRARLLIVFTRPSDLPPVNYVPPRSREEVR
jgi:hypothetical protein